MAVKKSKDDLKKEADQIKAIFDAAKKKEHNCAMVLCGDGSIAIEADPRLSADNLFKKARKRDGATPKGVKGLLNVKGTEIELTLSEEPPGGLETKFKQYLTKIGVKMKPTFILPGADAEAAKADTAKAQPDAPTPKQAAAPEEEVQPVKTPEISKDQLAANLKHVSEVFKLSFEGMDEETVKSLKAALKNIAAAVGSGDLVGAQNLMNKLTLLTGVGPNSPLQAVTLASPKKKGGADGDKGDAEARKKTLTKDFQTLKPEIQRSVRIANPAHKAEMEMLIKAFGKKMKSGDLDESEAALATFKRRIASFDKNRDKGRRAREARINDIVARIETLKARLDRIKTERSAG